MRNLDRPNIRKEPSYLPPILLAEPVTMMKIFVPLFRSIFLITNEDGSR